MCGVRLRDVLDGSERRKLRGVDHVRGRNLRELGRHLDERSNVYGVRERLHGERKRDELRGVEHVRGRHRTHGGRNIDERYAVRELSGR